MDIETSTAPSEHNDPNACGERFHSCHCVLAAGHVDDDGNPTPHECVPDPTCGGSWLRHPDDGYGWVRVYRYPSNRPGCDAYDTARAALAEHGIEPPVDPDPGEHHLDHDGILRAPRGGITYPAPPLIPGIGGW